ncbi:hypothetical protein HYT92_00910 [Candidatus Pacearchaeota archaeon]|nr:hypothetical protein [Candidatus Pacearchaeota archaeon]
MRPEEGQRILGAMQAYVEEARQRTYQAAQQAGLLQPRVDIDTFRGGKRQTISELNINDIGISVYLHQSQAGQYAVYVTGVVDSNYAVEAAKGTPSAIEVGGKWFIRIPTRVPHQVELARLINGNDSSCVFEVFPHQELLADPAPLLTKAGIEEMVSTN